MDVRIVDGSEGLQVLSGLPDGWDHLGPSFYSSHGKICQGRCKILGSRERRHRGLTSGTEGWEQGLGRIGGPVSGLGEREGTPGVQDPLGPLLCKSQQSLVLNGKVKGSEGKEEGGKGSSTKSGLPVA